MPVVIEERAPSADFGKVPGRTTGLICRDLQRQAGVQGPRASTLVA